MSIRFGLFVNSFCLLICATISFAPIPQWMQTIKSTTMIFLRCRRLSFYPKLKIPPFTSVYIIILKSSPIRSIETMEMSGQQRTTKKKRRNVHIVANEKENFQWIYVLFVLCASHWTSIQWRTNADIQRIQMDYVIRLSQYGIVPAKHVRSDTSK